jgi:putative oxidoreductase
MNNSLDSIPDFALSDVSNRSRWTRTAFSPARIVHVGARSLIALVFLAAGIGKLMAVQGTAAYIRSKGLPAAPILAVAAAALELTAGALLVVGTKARAAAVALAVFLVLVTAIFHNPVGLPPAEAQAQAQQVFKNLAILGGLLLIAARAPARARSRSVSDSI